MLNPAALTGYLGKHISQICPNEFTSDHENHCAHFVSHVLGYPFGVTCRVMGKEHAAGANIRVQEVFPRCTSVGTWASRPAAAQVLAFITNASNVDLKTKVMKNVPRKHVGIFYGGFIWHYSNAQRKVVQETPEQFSHHYPAPDNAMFFGVYP